MITRKIIPAVIIFFAGFFIAELNILSVGLTKLSHAVINPVEEKRVGGYDFISPLLECDARDSNEEIKPFKDLVAARLEKLKERSKISFGAVYFRDLHNGPWFGINEKENFSPASLFKVPVAIAYLKKSESKPNIMNQVIKYEKENEDKEGQYFEPSQVIQVNQEYPVPELIRRSIVYSDNPASWLLVDNIEVKYLENVFKNLALDFDYDSDPQVNVKGYAAFFRVLYNASYLNRENSEKLLALLSQVEFKDGLVKGVPEKIKVAHKFGERYWPEPGNETPEKQLHDCGIIYYPDHPYLLCVMTRGRDYEDMADTIKDISELVYNEVDKQFKDK